MHDLSGTTITPLVELPFDALCPGSRELESLMATMR
jgi:hypothetical protein